MWEPAKRGLIIRECVSMKTIGERGEVVTTGMQTVEQAAALVAARMTRLGTEMVALRQALGRMVARDIFAPRPLPGFDNSAMDGYAVRSTDLPAVLPIHSTAAAGQARFKTSIPTGVAVRIFTGAAMPPGLDTVIMQERATLDDVTRQVELPAASAGDNVRRTGEDIAPGELAVAAGTRLGPGELGLLAALGIEHVEVVKKPRVAVIATGDELVDVSTATADGQIVNCSGLMLVAMLEQIGAVAIDLGIAKDDPTEMANVLGRALEYDAVITTGGVSVGDRDYVHAAFKAAGVTLELYKVAMKPGKPFSFGMKDKVPVFGLPGNPISTFVAYELFVRPAVLAMQGAAVTARPRVSVVLRDGYRKQSGRAHYLRASVVRDGGQLIAQPHPKQGSAMMSSLVGCNALVEIAAEAAAIEANAVVPAILLEAV